MGGPRLSPVKWFDMVLYFPWIVCPSADAGNRGDVKAGGATVQNSAEQAAHPSVRIDGRSLGHRSF